MRRRRRRVTMTKTKMMAAPVSGAGGEAGWLQKAALDLDPDAPSFPPFLPLPVYCIRRPPFPLPMYCTLPLSPTSSPSPCIVYDALPFPRSFPCVLYCIIQFVWYIFSPVPPPCVLYCTPTRMYLYVPSTHKYKVWYVLPFEWILYGLYGPDLPIVQFKRLIIVMTLESKHPSQAVPEVPVTWTLNSKSSCCISNQSAQFRQMTDRNIFISFYVSHTEL